VIGWMLLAIGSEIVVKRVYPKRFMKGIISRFITRRLGRFGILKVEGVLIITLYVSCRVSGSDLPFILFPLFIIARILDDYINGDDDERKRRRMWLRNKLKWKMKLPELAPASSRS
jgi:TctA family transporter